MGRDNGPRPNKPRREEEEQISEDEVRRATTKER